MALLNVEDYRQEARRLLPRFVFDYLDGGSEDELAVKENRAAFERIRLTPRLLNDVSVRDQGIDWFGRRLPSPIVIAPTGLNGLYRKDGDILLARAAARLGIPFALSTASNNSIEQVANASNGDLWFQLYVMNRDFADQLVDRALVAGFSHLVLTVDVPMGGKRERDERNNFVMPFRFRRRRSRTCFVTRDGSGTLVGTARRPWPIWRPPRSPTRIPRQLCFPARWTRASTGMT